MNTGDKVQIKTGWAKGEWAIVRLVLAGQYHVGIAGDTRNLLVFERKELKRVEAK